MFRVIIYVCRNSWHELVRMLQLSITLLHLMEQQLIFRTPSTECYTIAFWNFKSYKKLQIEPLYLSRQEFPPVCIPAVIMSRGSKTRMWKKAQFLVNVSKHPCQSIKKCFQQLFRRYFVTSVFFRSCESFFLKTSTFSNTIFVLCVFIYIVRPIFSWLTEDTNISDYRSLTNRFSGTKKQWM